MTARKIALVTYEAYPSYIGLSTRVRGLALALKAQGWDVLIAAPDFTGNRIGVVEHEGIPVHQITLPDVLKRIRIPIVGRICYSLILNVMMVRYFWKKSIRLDFIQSEQIFPLPACWLIARGKKAGLIFDDPSMMGLFIREKIKFPVVVVLLEALVKLVEQVAAHLPDYIFCSSVRTVDFFKTARTGGRGVFYVPNGIDGNHSVLPVVRKSAARLFFNCSLPYYQNVAALRNIAQVIKLLDKERLNPYSVRIIVNTLSMIPSDIAEFLGNHPRVDISSAVPDIHIELNTADFILLPFEKGHFSTGGIRLKTVESLASGGLVLSTEEGVDGISELIADEHFIRCRDYTDMAERLKRLLVDKIFAVHEIGRMGTNARSLIIRKYSWKNISGVYDVLSECCGKKILAPDCCRYSAGV